MKIGFFGTPDIAAFCLEKLIEKYEVTFVVTCGDKPRGRCLNVSCTPVKNVASANNIKILQPQTLKDAEVISEITAFEADIYVVVAYGFIIPKEIFNQPRLGTINLHPSLLPKYRGAAPIQWALINGEQESGVTVQKVNEKLDAGDIVLQKKLKLSQDISSKELFEQVLPLGADMLCESIEGLASGEIVPVKQVEEDAVYCGKIDRGLARIEWSKSHLEIHNLVRGLNPKPVAWTTLRDKNVKIWQTNVPDFEGLPQLEAGELAKFHKKHLLVGTGEGVLQILKIQPENKKQLDAVSFMNGARLEAGEKFL
jgi:methionyl-tRNA formyltransferase